MDSFPQKSMYFWWCWCTRYCSLISRIIETGCESLQTRSHTANSSTSNWLWWQQYLWHSCLILLSSNGFRGGYCISNFYCIDKLSDMFHELCVNQHLGESVCEAFFMDVVLNHAIIPSTTSGSDSSNGWWDFNLDDDFVDYKFCLLIGCVLLLRWAMMCWCGCWENAPHDMSWLCLATSQWSCGFCSIVLCSCVHHWWWWLH